MTIWLQTSKLLKHTDTEEDKRYMNTTKGGGQEIHEEDKRRRTRGRGRDKALQRRSFVDVSFLLNFFRIIQKIILFIIIFFRILFWTSETSIKLLFCKALSRPPSFVLFIYLVLLLLSSCPLHVSRPPQYPSVKSHQFQFYLRLIY